MINAVQQCHLRNLQLIHTVTETQLEITEKLLHKGWMDPFWYAGCVRLGRANVWHKKNRGVIFRDYTLLVIRVTKTGRILCR
jgi:hypothetical protein